MLDALLDRLWDGVILAAIAWTARDSSPTSSRWQPSPRSARASSRPTCARAAPRSATRSRRATSRAGSATRSSSPGSRSGGSRGRVGDVRHLGGGRARPDESGREGGARVTIGAGRRRDPAGGSDGSRGRDPRQRAFVLAYQTPRHGLRGPCRRRPVARSPTRLGRVSLPVVLQGQGGGRGESGAGARTSRGRPARGRVDPGGVRAVRAVLRRLVPPAGAERRRHRGAGGLRHGVPAARCVRGREGRHLRAARTSATGTPPAGG